MRLIHTSDVRLDASYAACGLGASFGRRRREGLRAAFRALLKRAAKWPADAVLVAGNLFDLEYIEPATVRFLQESFESLNPVPIVIAPGDRDPFVEESPYAVHPWPDNVVIFHGSEWRAREIEAAHLLVHGLGNDGAPSSDPFARLAVEDRPGFGQVALAGTPGRADAGPVPLDTEHLNALPLDYIALGSGDVVQPIAVEAGVAAYCAGAPEGHGFEEAGPRHYLEVEIDAQSVRVTPVISSGVVFERVTLDVAEIGDQESIVNVLESRASAEAGRCVLELTLTGMCPPALGPDWTELRNILEGAFESLVLHDGTVPSKGARAAETALTRELCEEMRDAPAPDREAFLRRALQLGVLALRSAPLGAETIDER